MRIVIDMQGAQSTGSRNRGIGRYTQSLVQAIVNNRGANEIIIVLNSVFPESIAPIRAAFEAILPPENIRVWQAPPGTASVNDANAWRRKTAELVREAFLASLKPDFVLVTSLFEGFTDDAVTSIGALASTIPTAVVLYDLIPLIQRHHYLQNPVVERWYENKLDHLRRADLLLAISESSRQEGIRYLGFSEQECVTISTAADAHFAPLTISLEQEQAVRARYGLHRPFVMYTGGIDHRKNIEGLIRAYATLPAALRQQHQLAIVCSIQPQSRHELETLALAHNLAKDELVLTGFVPEEDLLALYNLCRMFVFPSWHEGFGLPALEAMACGRAVVGANTSSLPEVIGRADALFDPHSDSAIAAKLEQVLSDDAFRAELERYGREQAKKFSWNASALRTLEAITAYVTASDAQRVAVAAPRARPKLAYVAPLPPERSGIADYSAELLPELARHYDIDVIVAQDKVSDPWIMANCTVRNPEWLREHAQRYARVVYHFGNSHFHQHMFDLLEEVPGIVVLHDFFLSGIASYMELSEYEPGYWTRSLYESHGYPAVRERFHAHDPAEVIWRYPANLGVLRSALGMIVHSENSRRLAQEWYGGSEAQEWANIPHLRVPEVGMSRAQARAALGLAEDSFVVCSFGLLGPTKLNQRLLDAWMASSLAGDKRCVLVFVGENQQGDYGATLLETIRRADVGERIRITGWADTATFRQYLAAADVGVQLRTLSRGETSGTVLDCMNYGLATIVNANGSMADLAGDGILMLADAFQDSELVEALEMLRHDEAARARLGARARSIIHTAHAPRRCADLYAQAIESVYENAVTQGPALMRALARIEPSPQDDGSWVALSQALATSIAPRYLARQLLVDVSSVVTSTTSPTLSLGPHGDLDRLLDAAPDGWRVEPVYAVAGEGYRYARQFTLRLMRCPEDALRDEPVELRAGDRLLVPGSARAQQGHDAVLEEAGNIGVRIEYVD